MKITKEEYDSVREEYEADMLAKEQEVKPKKEKQPLSFFKFGQKNAMKKSLKKNDEILVFLLNLKKNIEGPMLVKIYGGNFLVIRNHIYRFNPDRVFNFSKYKAVIAREFDRELIGIDDYEKLVQQDFASDNPGGRVNIDDPVLIKALIQARLSEKPAISMGGKWIWIVLILGAVIIGFFWLTGKKTPEPTPTPTP